MRVGFIGRSEMIYNTIKIFLDKKVEIGFVYTCKSEKNYKKNEIDIKKLCQKYKILYFCDTKINSKISKLKKTKVKLVLSINYKTKLSKKLLNLFELGVFNAHLGDLPKFRGNATPNWAIIKEKKNIPLCLHKMTDIIDEGPIAKKIFYKISKKTYIQDIYNWLNIITPKEFYKLYLNIIKKKVNLKKQIGKPLIVFSRKEQDSRIDWNLNSKDIYNLVRASSTPFQGAYTYFNKSKIRVLSCKIYKPKFDYYAIPGQVCLIKKNNPVIASKDNMIEITKLSENYKKDLQLKKLISKSLRNRLN